MKYILFILLITALCLQVQAQSTTYGGGSLPIVLDEGYNSDYSPHGNRLLDNQGVWNSGSASMDLFLGEVGSGTNSIAGTTAPHFFNANFNIGATEIMAITNSQGIQVAGTLNFNNGLTTTIRSNHETGAVDFLNSATYTNSDIGDTQYVNGYVSKIGNSAFTFPIGSQDGTDYRSLSISAPTAITDHISVAYWSGDVGTDLDPTGGAHDRDLLNTTGTVGVDKLNSISPIGFWDWIPVVGNSSVSVTLSLPPFNVIGGYSDASFMRIVGWNIITNQWDNLSGTVGASSLSEGTTMTSLPFNMANYSALGIGNVKDDVLPVHLVSFSARAIECDIQFNWRTAREYNSSSFEIEHSSNGISYTAVGRVISKNQISGGTYTFTYTPIHDGQHYFRLRMIDEDDSFTYSRMETVKTSCGNPAIHVYPNPAHSIVNVEGLKEDTKVLLMNIQGQNLLEHHMKKANSSLDLSTFPTGLYILKVIEGNGKITNLSVLKN